VKKCRELLNARKYWLWSGLRYGGGKRRETGDANLVRKPAGVHDQPSRRKKTRGLVLGLDRRGGAKGDTYLKSGT